MLIIIQVIAIIKLQKELIILRVFSEKIISFQFGIFLFNLFY